MQRSLITEISSRKKAHGFNRGMNASFFNENAGCLDLKNEIRMNFNETLLWILIL